MKKLIRRSKIVFSLAFIYRNFLVKFLNKKTTSLTPEESKILQTLKRDGIVAIPNYFSEEQVQTMKDEYDRYVDKHSFFCEENERRVFGIDKLSPQVKNIFSDDQLSHSVCQAYLEEEMVLQSTMSARIDYKESIEYGSGGSWHRDSFSRQIKSIAYLTDMTDENGPFMYIKGSHTIPSILKVLFKLPRKAKPASDRRYTNQDIEEVAEILGKEISYFPCEKGTLVLADIRGLHTTRYLKGGHAYSIFNYYIAKTDHNPEGVIMEIEKKCINGEFTSQT